MGISSILTSAFFGRYSNHPPQAEEVLVLGIPPDEADLLLLISTTTPPTALLSHIQYKSLTRNVLIFIPLYSTFFLLFSFSHLHPFILSAFCFLLFSLSHYYFLPFSSSLYPTPYILKPMDLSQFKVETLFELLDRLKDLEILITKHITEHDTTYKLQKKFYTIIGIVSGLLLIVTSTLNIVVTLSK